MIGKYVDDIIIAKKYATAFLNLHKDFLQEEHINHFLEIATFLLNNKILYISLRIPSIDRETKKLAIEKIVRAFNLGRLTRKLMLTLIDHGRIEILDKVLTCIALEFKKRKRMLKFTITSSHELTPNQRDQVHNFIAAQTSGTITCSFTVDPSLIVGLRIVGDTYLWERSIEKQLRDVSQAMLHKG